MASDRQRKPVSLWPHLFCGAGIALCFFCAAPQAAATPDTAATQRGIAALEKELGDLKKQQTALKKQLQKQTAARPAPAAEKIRPDPDIADYTRNLSAWQQQLDAAFLALGAAPARDHAGTANAILPDDPEAVLAAAREEWLARAVAENALAAIRTENTRLAETQRRQNAAEERHRQQAQILQTHRARLDNLAHQIGVTQKLLAEQRQQLAEQRAAQALEKQQFAARKPARKPATDPAKITVAALPQVLPSANRADKTSVKSGRLPVNGKIVMKFGDKDLLGATSTGIVLEAAQGENIVLPQEGVVKFAGAFGKFKQLLIVEHKGGYHSVISGYDALKTKIGERLPAGAVIGQLAQAQAYYELRHNGVPVDPDKVSIPF